MAQAVRLLRAPDFDPRREAIVESPGPVPAFRFRAARQVKVLATSPRTVLLEVDSPARPICDLRKPLPGWRAFIRGQGSALHYTNVAFRGLPVPAGRHLILMRFSPPLLKRLGVSAPPPGLAAPAASGSRGRRYHSGEAASSPRSN